MNTSQHLTQEDLALFALQLLEGPELTAALDHLEACEDCRHEVARLQGDLVTYALGMSEPASPPAAARERLLAQVAKEKKVLPPERVAPPLRRSSSVLPLASSNASQAYSGDTELSRLAQRAREFAAEQHEAAQQENAQQDAADFRTPPPSGQPAHDGRAHEEAVASGRVADGDVFLAARGRRMFEMDSPDEEAQPVRSRSAVASVLGWTGWAVAACACGFAVLQYRERQSLQGDVAAVTMRLETTNDSLDQAQSALRTLTDQGAMQVALHQPVNNSPQPPRPEGHAAYDAPRGALVFIGEHLDQVPANKVYELWLLQPDNPDGTHRDPVPAGTFRPDARGVGRVIMPEIPKGLAAIGFGVTVENEGGSPKPTSGIVLAGL